MQGANQLVLSQEETEILKKIVQYVERKKQNKELKIYDSDHLEEKKVMLLYETFLNKLTNTVYAKKLVVTVAAVDSIRMVEISLKCIFVTSSFRTTR